MTEKRRPATSIRTHVMLIGLAASVVATLLLTGTTMVIFLENSLGNLNEYGAYIAESLAAASIDDLLMEAHVSLEGTVGALYGRHNLVDAFVAGHDGTIVAALDRKILGLDLDSQLQDGLVYGGGPDIVTAATAKAVNRASCGAWLPLVCLVRYSRLVWTWPVAYEGVYLGEAVVVLSLDYMKDRLSYFVGTGIIAGLAAFLISGMVGLALALRVSAPIERLAAMARAIQEGDIPAKPASSAVHEVDQLAVSMIDMATTLESRRSATEDARAMAAAARDELQGVADRLRVSLDERTTLLREVHHRVKNNLQVIISMLELQLDGMRDEHDRESLSNSQTRIRSMALVHDMLYQSENFTAIDLDGYLRALASDVVAVAGVTGRTTVASGRHHDGITVLAASGESGESGESGAGPVLAPSIIFDLEPVQLCLDQAVPLGLIASELLTNTLRHAFSGHKRGTVRIQLTTLTDADGMRTVLLVYEDDGNGHAGEDGPQAGLGLTMIDALVSQLGASADFSWNAGCRFSLRFPAGRPAGGQVC